MFLRRIKLDLSWVRTSSPRQTNTEVLVKRPKLSVVLQVWSGGQNSRDVPSTVRTKGHFVNFASKQVHGQAFPAERKSSSIRGLCLNFQEVKNTERIFWMIVIIPEASCSTLASNARSLRSYTKREVCLVTEPFPQDLISFGRINIPTVTLNVFFVFLAFPHLLGRSMY